MFLKRSSISSFYQMCRWAVRLSKRCLGGWGEWRLPLSCATTLGRAAGLDSSISPRQTRQTGQSSSSTRSPIVQGPGWWVPPLQSIFSWFKGKFLTTCLQCYPFACAFNDPADYAPGAQGWEEETRAESRAGASSNGGRRWWCLSFYNVKFQFLTMCCFQLPFCDHVDNVSGACCRSVSKAWICAISSFGAWNQRSPASGCRACLRYFPCWLHSHIATLQWSGFFVLQCEWLYLTTVCITSWYSRLGPLPVYCGAAKFVQHPWEEHRLQHRMWFAGFLENVLEVFSWYRRLGKWSPARSLSIQRRAQVNARDSFVSPSLKKLPGPSTRWMANRWGFCHSCPHQDTARLFGLPCKGQPLHFFFSLLLGQCIRILYLVQSEWCGSRPHMRYFFLGSGGQQEVVCDTGSEACSDRSPGYYTPTLWTELRSA